MKNSHVIDMKIPPREAGEHLRNYVYRTLFENIMDLTLSPGMMVSDIDLANSLGCSRTPVREAFFQLRDIYLVDIYPQSGVFITPIDFKIIDEMQFMRVAVESNVIQKLCGSIESPAIAKLSENLLLQENACNLSEGNDRFFSLDKAFHAALYESANYMLIQDIMLKSTTHIDRLTYFLAKHGLPYIQRSLREHKQIFDCILKHDKDSANKIVYAHMMEYQKLSIPEGFESFFRNQK